MEKKTIIINLMGAPSAGKSTMMADVFAELKYHDIDCEMVSEFAKELVWENRQDTFTDEIYIFAKQNHRLHRVNGKVDVIITDRPLILTCLYNKNKALNDLVVDTFNKYDNTNFLLKRVKKYNPNGRNQTEHESDKLYAELKGFLDEKKINYKEIEGNLNGAKYVSHLVTEMLDRKGK